MALETSTLVNGEWTTQTLDVNSVLQHYDQQDKEATIKFSDVDRPPVYALLTQTVIRSPQAHWILPVKIRNPDANDVAFIGSYVFHVHDMLFLLSAIFADSYKEDFVQIRELRPDGHLCDVIRKENFGAKIHNARIIGSLRSYIQDPDTGSRDLSQDVVKFENPDVDMNGISTKIPKLHQGLDSNLPPQSIVLHLDSGDFCFLMLRRSRSGGLEFVSTRHRVAKLMLTSSKSKLGKPIATLDGPSWQSPQTEVPSRAKLSALQAGMHLAVDPSSRYMAIGCSQDIFAIYALHTRNDLKAQAAKGSDLRHIQSERYITIPGVIHKMEFLYPSPNDEEHVILVILVVRGGKTRMVVFEWQAGMDLRKITSHGKRGHLLDKSRRMPLLLIPLTIKSAFILVSESSMTLCLDILSGAPQCTDFNTEFDPPTSFHQGLGPPLWVSWTRPPRLGYHAAVRDDLYIAREDGLVKFFEIDSEEFVNAEINISHFQGNAGTALASLGYEKYNEPGKTGDLLITGGDSCPGGTYLVRAREFPSFNETVPNWSPAIDFVTTARDEDLDSTGMHSRKYRKKSTQSPDRIFICNGTGLTGAVTEFRYGLEAAIGTIIPYDTPIMSAWVLSPTCDSLAVQDGLLFLLSLGNRSAIISLSHDASTAEAVDEDATMFDLKARTIVAGTHGNFIRQVTEHSIVVVNGSNAHTHCGESLLGLARAIENAVIYQDVVLFITLVGNECLLNVLVPEPPELLEREKVGMEGASIRKLHTFSTRVTSLALCLIGQSLCAVVAAWCRDFTELTFQPINGAKSCTLQLPNKDSEGIINLDAIVSMAVAQGPSDSIILLCGTRNGFVLTLDIAVEDEVRIVSSRCDRFGALSAIITKDESQGSQEIFFVSCGSRVCTLNPEVSQTYARVPRTLRRSSKIEQIWLTDALNPALQQPEIVSVVRMPDTFGGTEGGNLLVVAGNDLILARLSPQPKAVPRPLSIGGTPRRLLYSHDLGALVVAATINGKTALLFIDPDTGEDLSKPVDKTGASVDCVAGLGKTNEKILGLLDWPFVKDGRTWKYLVVTTSNGRVLLISYEKEDYPAVENRSSTTRPKIRFHTRFKFRHMNPVCAVTGFPEGILYCSGETLYCEYLDLAEKRFRRVAEYKLSSPATNLSLRNDTIYAMTAAHSLEVLHFERESDSVQTPRICATHFDQNQRFGLHHMETGLGPRLSLISDKDSSVTGLWATPNMKADTLDTLFEAEMHCSIQRFRTGKCRPMWDPVWQSPSEVMAIEDSSALGAKSVSDKLDIIPTSHSEAELLGLAMDGSLSHFTVLGETAWFYLRFVQNLAIRSPVVCQFTYDTTFKVEPSQSPKTMMHVNGDILKRCLDERRLEELLCPAEDEHTTPYFKILVGALKGLHRDEPELLQELEKDATLYVEQAYADLEFYLRPVL